MGFFFTDSNSKGKIHHRDLEDHLKDIDGLREHEREFVLGKFDHLQGKHITKDHLDKIFREIRNDTSDSIESTKADRMHKHLLEIMKDSSQKD